MQRNWKRNTKGLLSSAASKRQACFGRADEAIQLLLKENKPINFNTVAETAKVSVGWLYRQPELKKRIQYLREQQAVQVNLPRPKSAAETTKNQMIENLKGRIREQDEQINQLTEQLRKWGGLIRQQAEEIEQLKKKLGETV